MLTKCARWGLFFVGLLAGAILWPDMAWISGSPVRLVASTLLSSRRVRGQARPIARGPRGAAYLRIRYTFSLPRMRTYTDVPGMLLVVSLSGGSDSRLMPELFRGLVDKTLP